MRTLKFTVPGAPQAQQRARSGRGGRHYTPDESRHYQEEVALMARLHHNGPPIAGDVIAIIQVHAERNGDLDNYAKALLDACVKAQVLRDDIDIEDLHIFRVPPTDPRKAEVRVTLIERGDA
jgi:Holliday junction resolvase RusA-like endonuclease